MTLSDIVVKIAGLKDKPTISELDTEISSIQRTIAKLQSRMNDLVSKRNKLAREAYNNEPEVR